jgi:hypothetical protein
VAISTGIWNLRAFNCADSHDSHSESLFASFSWAGLRLKSGPFESDLTRPHQAIAAPVGPI